MKFSEWLLQTATALIAPGLLYVFWRTDLLPRVDAFTGTCTLMQREIERIRVDYGVMNSQLQMFAQTHNHSRQEANERLRNIESNTFSQAEHLQNLYRSLHPEGPPEWAKRSE